MQSFDSDGVQIAYIDVPAKEPVKAGNGDPILLIHGFASNHAVNWSTRFGSVSDRSGLPGHRPRQPGHGQSEKLYEPSRLHLQ